MSQRSIESVVSRVRPEVRRGSTYKVGGTSEIDVKLNQNESPFELPEQLQAEFIDNLSELDVHRYPLEFPRELIKTLASKYKLDPNGIIIGHGSNELSHFLAICFLNPGDKVVLPRPMFALYSSVTRLFGAELVEVPCLPKLQFDVAALVTEIQRVQPALTIVANPNNPTGLAIDRQSIRQILEASDGIVVVDEAYIEFAPEYGCADMLTRHPNLIILRTMSKAFGLAGLRVGYLVAHPELTFEMKKARLPFMIGRHDELCAITLLQNSELTERWSTAMAENTLWMQSALKEIPGVVTYPTTTNFFLFETNRDPRELAAELAKKKIAVREMSSYPELASMLRVCAGTMSENQKFVNALKSLAG